MLQNLRVKNFAIVEAVEIAFRDGLNVITGETGAGKSILVGALGLVLGDRAGRSLIRDGADTCSVEAEFELSASGDVDAVLQELGLEPCDHGRLVVRRSVASSGSGRCFVNDGSCTAQALKRIGDLLVDMHGPHDHQSLLNRDFQLDILDAFAHLQEKRANYEELYDEWLELERRRRALETDDDTVAQQIDLLSYQVKEISDAQLDGRDEEELEREHSTLANANRIGELADGITNALTEDDTAAFNGLAFAQKALAELEDIFETAGEWKQEAQSIAIQLQELSTTIAGVVQDIESDPERLRWLEDRMALLHKLKRKYGPTVQAILEAQAKAKARLNDLETRGEQLAELDQQLQAAGKRVRAAGKGLAKARRTAGEALAEAITAQLRDLGFPHGTFAVDLTACEPRRSGLDEVEFGFAPNAGEAMRPLRTIASSGEISRVMLATKAVLGAHDRIPVLVFDEIDANVGGEMGNAIGSKLACIASGHQVLCITHLPQVAVHGATHIVVSKDVKGGRTRTQIQPVEGKQRAEEVARMLGGKGLTSVTLRHAKEMLAR